MARALKHSLFVSLLLGLFLATFEVTFAQSPCGDFVTIEDFEGGESSA